MIDKKGKAIYLAFAGLFAISVFMGDPAASAAEKTETISAGCSHWRRGCFRDDSPGGRRMQSMQN